MQRGIDEALNGAGVQMGLINSFKTDNQIVNILICLCIPIFLKLLLSFGDNFSENCSWALEKVWYGRVTRTIEVKTKENDDSWWGNAPKQENRNDLLQKAVSLYIAHIRDSGMNAFPINKGNAMFMAFDDSANAEQNEMKNRWRGGGGNKEGEEENSQNSMLKKFSVFVTPSDREEVQLKPNLWFTQRERMTAPEAEDGAGGGKRPAVTHKTKTMTFRSVNPGGEKRIDDFLKEAVDYFSSKLAQDKDESRYLYLMSSNGDPDFASTDKDGGGGGRRGGGDGEKKDNKFEYKRYKLSDEKSFTNMYFPEKRKLLELLDNFANKTSKYAVPGFPHKIGLLLYGQPGTGKTR